MFSFPFLSPAKDELIDGEELVVNDDKPCGRCAKYDNPQWVSAVWKFIVLEHCELMLIFFTRFCFVISAMRATTPPVSGRRSSSFPPGTGSVRPVNT